MKKLADDEKVKKLLYVKGKASDGAGLRENWASGLLRTGKITISGKDIDFGTGVWSNNKYVPHKDHYNHVHITLDRAKLGEPD